MQIITQTKYRTPLCPYLMIGNRGVLLHLDAYCVPQSLNWPRPGSPDRLGWRDPFDEWPYWEEMDQESIRARMPYFEYQDGNRAYLHDALEVAVDYVEDTNVLQGRYRLPGGAVVSITTFVPPDLDVWVRDYQVEGHGCLVLQSEFFEKAVRGHALAHLGNVNFRGAFDAPPQGAYVIMSTTPLQQVMGRVPVAVDGATHFTLFMAMAADIRGAVKVGEQALVAGCAQLQDAAVQADRAWLARAREPVARHPFVRKHYKRWLLSNMLLICRDGAMVCGPRPFWSFVWPRDGSLDSIAFAAAGFMDEARLTIKWQIDRTPASGVHAARYRSDGHPMLLDNRARQGDNPGFLCWAAGEISRREWDQSWTESIRDNLYIMADHLVRDRDADTLLPLPESDHRESQVAESIGVVVTAFGGLTGAAHIAERLGDAQRARRYRARAEEIRRAAEQHLWNAREEYFITSIKPVQTRSDVATAWGVYPFALWTADDPKSKPAMDRLIRDRWNGAAGGVLAAPGTPYESYWMFYTSILLLGVAGVGDRAMEREILDSLERNVSPQGMVPEQVGRTTGNLWGCAPLPTAHAGLLLYAYHDFRTVNS
ncbi:MAG: hypothetical protein ABR497_00810 [Kiritimatiellia bacterium]|nr:hypothetical protein [Lentisphaerota bacterium]